VPVNHLGLLNGAQVIGETVLELAHDDCGALRHPRNVVICHSE
jgi:hypothetical protein